MRRHFFRFNAVKFFSAALATIVTQLTINYQTLINATLAEFKGNLAGGFGLLYILIGPQNTYLRIGAIIVFWFVVARIVYFVIWLLEMIYIRTYNYIVVKARFTR